MPEIRKDYLLEKFVIVAAERDKRPQEFKAEKQKQSPKKSCPLCPKNEHMIPGVIEEAKIGDTWEVRVIWNKYKAAKPDGNPNLKTDNTFYTYADSVGDHEVIIETPKHGVEFEDLDDSKIIKVITIIIKRIAENYKKGAEYVSVFKNRGGEAGASLSHSHHQLVAYNLFPTELKKEIGAIAEYKTKKGSCAYCDIISSEKNSDRRIGENELFVAFAPYASMFPMEAWILPKKCLSTITALSEEEIKKLASILKKTLQTLNKLNYPSYNLIYRIAREKDEYHFRIEITPRMARRAGFEFSTGTVINSVSPEAAAKFYRGEE